MTHIEFMQLPAGQRRVVLSRARDVVADEAPRLDVARSELLATLSTLAIQANADDYAGIFRPSLIYGFDKRTGNWVGDRRIRNSLCEAATFASQPNHRVMVAALLDWLKTTSGLDRGEAWYYHAIRDLITHLMVNAQCADDDAAKLDAVLNDVYEKLRILPNSD